MIFRKRVSLLRKFDYYIQTGSTGNPKCLAEKLRISESSIYRLKEELEFLGAEIKYNSKTETYFYVNSGVLKLEFE